MADLRRLFGAIREKINGFDIRRRLDPDTRAGRAFLWAYRHGPLLAMAFVVTMIVMLIVLVMLKSALIEAERQSAIKKERPAVNVVVQKLSPGPIRDRIELPAVVEPWEEIEVKAEVRGKVVEQKAAEGRGITKGDIIVQLDPRDYEYALKSARAANTLAQQTLKRTEALRKRGVAPQSQYDAAVAQAESALAGLRNAELSLERTRIRSPLDGTVNRLDAREGNLLAVGDPVAEVIQIDPVKVSVGIPESDVNEVRSIGTFGITIDALSGRELEGTTRYLSKKPDNLARLYRLELEVPNPEGDILPGMFARVNVVKRTVPDALSIPLYAVIAEGEKRFVYVAEDGVARRREVKTGILEGWLLEVVSGLKEGDRVIVVGHRSVGDGQGVNIINEVADPAEILQ